MDIVNKTPTRNNPGSTSSNIPASRGTSAAAPSCPEPIKVVKVPICKLKPHPKQAIVNPPLPDDDIQALADNIKSNGLQCPIEITPDGTIICGHQRVEAAKRLGWTEIDAKIRHDLAAQGEAAIVDRLMRDNLDRRHLDVLSKARYHKELKENANRLPYEQRRHCQGIDLRDQLAKRFNMSGRNLDRIVRVLSTPIEVQQAVSANRLTVKEAGQVAGAKVEVQAKIAEEIKAGQDPKDVVAKRIPKKVRKRAFNGAAFGTFLNHLENDVPDLETRLDQLRRPREDEAVLLRRTCKLIDTYLKQKPAMSEEEHDSLLSDTKKEIEDYLAKAS